MRELCLYAWRVGDEMKGKVYCLQAVMINEAVYSPSEFFSSAWRAEESRGE
jgi:hypothetical protein